MRMTTVYLLRHGALAADARERFIGQIDLPLAPAGVGQAAALGRALCERGIDAIYCSDLERSRQTAAIVAAEQGGAKRMNEPRELPALREISLGDWEGMSRHELVARHADEFTARGRDIANYRPPGGESFADCRERALAAWDAIRRGGHRCIVIVGHAGINRTLLCHLLDMPLAKLFCIDQDYGCVNIIDDGERPLVRLINGRPADINRNAGVGTKESEKTTKG
jgi:probable phosphoglycerate mutase